MTLRSFLVRLLTTLGCLPLLIGMVGASLVRSQGTSLLIQMAADVWWVLPAWMGGIGGGL